MDTPSWLPRYVATNFSRMVGQGLLNERERAFFTDDKLKCFWDKAGNYLTSKIHQNRCQDASDCFVATFISPLSMYAETGTADRPTPKVKIREAQKEADTLFDDAARLTGELVLVLEKLESTARCYPDEMWLMPVVRKLISEPLTDLSSASERVRTREALMVLNEAFQKYPRSGTLFKDGPGMASQKATWRDWLREAKDNITTMLGVYPGKFEMQERDWVNLVHVLISDDIARSTLQHALKDS